MSEPILYSIATPIGNLGDITLRALEVMRQADALVCEDTRETRKLLTAHAIPAKKLISYHAHSTAQDDERILDYIAAGHSVGLISDRGTPGISDPGTRLVTRAVARGIQVMPLPGAAAVITALQGAGVDTAAFWYRGYLPHKKGRATFLREAVATDCTVVFYESPHRIIKCLQQLIAAGVGTRPMVLARELTKQYEEFLRGDAASLLETLQARPDVRGEFVVIMNRPTL